MSGSSHNGQGQGQGNNNPPSFNPALLNANAALANFNPTYTNSSPSPFPNLIPSAPTSHAGHFSPEHLARMTEFHQSSPQRLQSPQHISPSTTTGRPLMQPHQMALFQIMPDAVRQAIISASGPLESKLHLVDEWAISDSGQAAIAQARTHATAQGSSSPSQIFGRQLTGSPSSRPGDLGSPQQSQPRNLSPEKPAATLQSPGQINTNLPDARRRSPKKPDVPLTQAFNPANLARSLFPSMNNPAYMGRTDTSPRPPGPPAQMSTPAQHQGPAYSNVQWIRPAGPTNPETAPRTAPPRRREEGMRGSMRSELSRLMYASGDVENPEIDTIDYMEDLVVDWLAELCTPPPPVRAGPSAPLVAPRLDYNIIRHRLSRPSMRKYLDRFEYMEYKAVDMRSARRVARGNFEPVDQKDLDTQLEDGFLDAEDSGQLTTTQRKKRKYQRANGQDKAVLGEGEVRERKKPGPKKGWRAGLNDEGPKGRGAKRARQSTGPSMSSGRGSSVKPEG